MQEFFLKCLKIDILVCRGPRIAKITDEKPNMEPKQRKWAPRMEILGESIG